ncbi:sulfotransferase domain-containing protein, partial [Pseudanabaena sp. CCNP1317]|uniref:sulfotransferase domain-containing protein n=1 Tax=Pseudanabaena sp. CCNP1317 TaxID=3110253 RepID=UPI002B1FB20B
MTAPHFMIIGAMKCGTTTLAAQLGAQPGIFMTTPKEPNFFSDDDVYRKGPGWYAALFENASSGDILGEASTHYTKLPRYPDTVARIKAAGIQPRLVYMIRNPLSRLISHYIHAVSENWTSDPLDLAIDRLPELIDYGLYGRQITPFVEAFGVESILLTSLERLKLQPEAELARIAAHIGHAGPVQWIEDLAEQNVSAERIR